jgi:hypothetical protein
MRLNSTGILEEGEECDCGAAWQCTQGEQCCGMRDGFAPCEIVKPVLKNGKCRPPTEW